MMIEGLKFLSIHGMDRRWNFCWLGNELLVFTRLVFRSCIIIHSHSTCSNVNSFKTYLCDWHVKALERQHLFEGSEGQVSDDVMCKVCERGGSGCNVCIVRIIMTQLYFSWDRFSIDFSSKCMFLNDHAHACKADILLSMCPRLIMKSWSWKQ